MASTDCFEEIAREAAEKTRRQKSVDDAKRRANVHEPGPALDTVWADDIAVNLDTGGAVDGLLPGTGLGVIYGESGCGKTFVAVDLACHVAAGLPWRGMDVEQGVVIYVAAEAPESLKRRVWAWKERHEVEHLPVLVVQSTVDLLNGDTDAIVELVSRVTDERGRVALVVIDTLARSMNGNENSPEDMGKYVASCARIREAGDTLTMVVHHAGKDLARGARGHSSLRAATDVELEVTKGEDGAGNVAVTKARDELDNGRFGFRLEPVELGTNAKGRTVTTCVAVEAEATAKTATKSTTLNSRQRLVLDCLSTVLVDHGQEAPAARDIPRNARVVSFARWCEASLRYLPSDKPDWRKREDFGRVVEALQAKHFVNHVDGWCWPTLMGGSYKTSQTSQTSQCDGVRGSAMAPRKPRIASHHPIGVRECEGCEATPRTPETETDRGKPSPSPEKPKPAKTTANCKVCKKPKALDADRLCEGCRPKPQQLERDVVAASQDEAPAITRVWRRGGLSNGHEWIEVPVLEVTASRVFVPCEWELGRAVLKMRRKVQRMALARSELETSGSTWFQYGIFYTDAGKTACEAKTAAKRGELP
jgi:KaiC/GvpD/RAD55 family RecA-like ATPase